MSKPISERIVATLEAPPSGNRRYHFPGAVLSGRVAPGGFLVRVTKNGVVSFVSIIAVACTRSAVGISRPAAATPA